ncbi:hypothetical protein EYR36_007917 [Pleurotus pulmonarius]|nr:hypothetical protein EYR36_007917 [Pleurotus pulmonarius]
MPPTSLYASPFVAGSTNASPFSLDSKDPQAMRRTSSSSSKFLSEDEDDDDEEDVPLIVLKTRYLLSGRTTKVGQGLGISMVPGFEQDRQERGFVSASTAKVGQGLGISMVPGLESRQERSVSLQRKKSIHHLKGSKIRSGRRGAVTMKIIESYLD